jgi:hypothetical protein
VNVKQGVKQGVVNKLCFIFFLPKNLKKTWIDIIQEKEMEDATSSTLPLLQIRRRPPHTFLQDMLAKRHLGVTSGALNPLQQSGTVLAKYAQRREGRLSSQAVLGATVPVFVGSCRYGGVLLLPIMCSVIAKGFSARFDQITENSRGQVKCNYVLAHTSAFNLYIHLLAIFFAYKSFFSPHFHSHNNPIYGMILPWLVLEYRNSEIHLTKIFQESNLDIKCGFSFSNELGI